MTGELMTENRVAVFVPLNISAVADRFNWNRSSVRAGTDRANC